MAIGLDHEKNEDSPKEEHRTSWTAIIVEVLIFILLVYWFVSWAGLIGTLLTIITVLLIVLVVQNIK
jgi:hypothetical protein